MPLLEAVGMTPTSKNFTIAIAFMLNEQATTYRWIFQHIKHLYFSSAVSIGNEQDEGTSIKTFWQKLTEMIKDEEVASRFVNDSWHKLLNETDEAEYLKILDILKTKWHNRPDFLHYLFNTWLNPLAHKFVRVWTSQVLHFGAETANYAESEHSILKLWRSICHGDLGTVFLNIDYLLKVKLLRLIAHWSIQA
ncbi:hypothetical protein M9H77_01925 [Catharanthus roseus]|uniref:Uncharacterized protein n=1 Tax=Catharanthus roseus TaxID=4058 RepID=A0ACC0C7F1_CATRO|nr:hypothetical protein M9H77_01925 [Catharanthus roseus]